MNFEEFVNRKGLTAKPFFIAITNKNLPFAKTPFKNALEQMKLTILTDKKFKKMYKKGGVIIGAFKFFDISILEEWR